MTVRRWIVLLSLLAILLLTAAVALLLPSPDGPDYLASEYVTNFFLSRIERNWDRKVEADKVYFRVFPRIELVLVDLTIREVDSAHVFLKAKRAEAVLRLFPLLRGEVETKRLTVDALALTVRRDRQGQWNFLKVGPSGASLDKSIGYPLRRVLLLREVTIRNGELAVIDESRPDGTRSVHLKALDLALETSLIRREAELSVAATLGGSTGTSSLSLAGKLTQPQAQVQIAEETVEGIMPAFQFEGTAEAVNLPLREIANFLGPQLMSEEVTGAVNLHGRLRLVPGVVGYDMVLSDLRANVKSWTFDGQATLSGLMTAQPTFALIFSSSKIQANELFDILPARWIHREFPKLLEEWDIQGTLEVVKATLTGVMTPEPRLSLTGEFRVHDGYAVVDKSGTLAKHVSGTIFLETDRIRAVELSGLYGTMRVDAGKALVSFSETGAWLELEFKGEMAAADLLTQVKIGDLVGSEQVTRAWEDRRDVQGITLVAFRISGPLDRPQEIKYVGADFEALDVSFSTSMLPDRVTGLNGRLVIAGREVLFDSLRCFVGRTQVEIQGRLTGDEKNAYQDFVITTRGSAEDLLQLVAPELSSKAPPLGTMGAVVGLSGPLTAPRFKGRLDLDDTAWTFPGLGWKPRGRQAALEFDGAFGKRAVPLVHRIELVLPSLRITGRGTIRFDKRFRINAGFSVGPIAVAQLPDWMKPKGLERGELEISLDVRGKGREWSAWQITGWVAVTDGVASLEGLDSVVRDISLRLKLVPDNAELKHLTFRILDSEARLSGIIRRWQTKPSMTLTVESSHFDLELLIPKGTRSPVRRFLADLAATSHVAATVNIKRGTYKLLSLLDLSCRVNIAKGVLDLDRIAGSSLPGLVNGRIVIRLPKRRAGSTAAVWRVAGLPFEDFHSLFSANDSPVSGDLYLTGSLRANGQAPRGRSSTLNGRTDFQIVKGRFLKDDSRAVWKILAALSLPAQLRGEVDLDKDGFPFDKITATMVVQDGRISSDNIIVDSPVVKMTAAGSYDIPTDQLDYVVAVSPFGPYTSLLTRIPLFGKLFKGERKGLTTALFDVKGPLDDPKVTYRPIKSLASGIGGIAMLAVDLLINIVTLPKEIIAPGKKDKGPNFEQVPELTDPPSP